MTIPSTSELALLRKHPHNSKVYLSVYQPKYVLVANVNDATITKGERAITYDGASWSAGWDYTKLNNGITMLVGNGTGDESKGRVRIRSATSTVITVAENSHIDWADNDVLTVLNFYEINPVYPRIIQDPADETKTIWYKDYDIEYDGQNSALGSFICMGCHYAGFVGDVYYTATGTYNLKSETLSYHWLFEGGNPTGSSAETPGNVAYATPGHYTTTLVVSGTSAGAVDTSYRHISIYDPPGTGAGSHLPITSWEIQDLSGSRDQGGYSANIRILQSLGFTYLSADNIYRPIMREGDLVILFAQDWYGDTQQSLGGNADHRQSIVFVGYVMKGSIQYNYRDSYVDFTVSSPTEVMKLSEGFGVSVQDSHDPEAIDLSGNIPSGWVTVLNMDIKRAIYHYLRWHTTVLSCCDVHFIGTDRPLQYFDSDRTSIYDAVNTVLQGAWLGKLVNDRQGALYCERDVYIEPTAYSRSFTLSKQDWMDDVIIDQSRQERTSFIEMGGIIYTGATGTYTAVLSNAPGVAPGYRGKTIRQEGLALLSQAELNRIAGAMYAQNNSLYPSVDIKIAGNYRNFDIAPQEKVPLTIDRNDTVRGIDFNDKDFFIQRVQWDYDPAKETFLPMISVSELCTGTAADTVAISTIPPTTGDNGGFYIPPITIPTITIPPFPTINVGGGGGNRPQFIQAISNYANPHFHLYGYTNDWLGVGFNDGSSMETSATLYIPIDYEGTLTISHMMVASSAGSGDISLETTMTNFYDSDLDDIYSDSSLVHYEDALETVDLSGGKIAAVRTVLVDVLPDSFLWMDFIRNGGATGDNLAKTVVLLGWRIFWG